MLPVGRVANASWGHGMSAIGVAIGRAVAGLGGPGTAAALVAGGIVVGVLGGGLATAAGSSQQGSATGQLAVYPCPETGPALVMVQAGQKVLVTGRTEDSAWLRIHVPLPGRSEGWVQTSPLTVDGSVAGLPVAACEPELAVVRPSLGPAESFTAVADNPPSAPPTTGPTATPSSAPSAGPTVTPNAKPSLTALTTSTRTVSYDTDSYCKNAVKKVTFSVKAGDSSGLDEVTLFWRKPGSGTYAQAAMTRTAGTAKSGTWQVTLDTTANGITKAGKLAYYAVATDAGGATRRLPTGSASTITVAVCANTGPSITAVKSSAGSTLRWDPLGAPGNCQTATNLTAAAKDPDGVKSVTLFYRRPGDSNWQSKPMNDQTVAGKWYANLDTLGDKITIPNPPTGSLKWYIKAVDGKGKASQTSTRSITIKRCDTEAQFETVRPASLIYSCSTTARVTIEAWTGDRDQPEDGLKVVFHWSLANNRNPNVPVASGQMAASVTKGNYYSGTSKTFTGSLAPSGTLTVYAVTTDKYGGKTQSSSRPFDARCQ